jgi:hypothetical protein
MKRTLSNLFWSQPKKYRANSKGFRPSFESLEDRRVMAVNVLEPIGAFGPAVNSPGTSLTAGVKDGTLYVRGTDKPDTITLRQQNNALKIDGVVGSFNINNFNNIVIRSFGGSDVINLKSEAVKGQQAITKATEIWGGIGLDNITGGRGNDSIFAEAGNDKVWGNLGDDIIDGGADNDELRGEVGRDKIFGDVGADKLWGGDNDDFLVGGDAVDYLYGGKGLDMLDGSLGNDFLYGEADYDYLYDDTAQKTDSGSNYFNNGYLGIGWFDRFMETASLRTEARFLYAPDFALNRTEMMDIFDTAEDGNVVLAGEFRDLQDIVSTQAIVIPDYVKSLANKVVNGDPSNSRFQGRDLGNLSAGATGEHLEDLVDKWFLGLDRPFDEHDDTTQTLNYQYVQGSLFQNGIDFTDISQGATGDCYYLSTLASLAERNPSWIEQMFIDNGDGTFTVRFFTTPSTAHYVTVDRYLPVSASGREIYADFGANKDDPNNELWVALAEKAFAQFNESGWHNSNATNSYGGIWGGGASRAMARLTGWEAFRAPVSENAIPFSADDDPVQTREQIISRLNAGKLMAISDKADPPDPRIPGNHVYAVLGYNSLTETFTIFNPWGFDRGTTSLAQNPALMDLSWTEIVDNFGCWHYN